MADNILDNNAELSTNAVNGTENKIGSNTAKVLIVDDLLINVELLKNIVEAEGYETMCALNVYDALDMMNKTLPQLILSDFSMPGVDGLEFCRLTRSNPKTRDIPFVFITVADSREDKKAAFMAGASDFILKPIERVEVIMRINNHLKSYQIKRDMEEYNKKMHRVVMEQKIILEQERENVLLGLAKIMAKRNVEEAGHIERVAYNCRVLAQSMQLTGKFEDIVTDQFIDTITVAARLHDVGNLLMPDEMYKNRFTSEEKYIEAVKFHTEEGSKILKEISEGCKFSRFLDMATLIAKYHHTHWDGNGIPSGVQGEDIPLAARIVSIVNNFDMHMVKGITAEEAVTVMNKESGSHYDPDIMKVFSKVVNKLKTV